MANVAKPLTAVTLVVPCNATVPALRVAVTTVLLSVVTRFPKASTRRTTGAGEKAVPAVVVVGGWVWMTRLAAAEGLTVNALLTALLKPLALAVSCLLAPAVSICKLLNETVPLPPPVPMSKFVAPERGPVPEVRFTVTFRLVGNPATELLPNWS